ncbi:MAG: hypothetical protein FWG55_04795 [Candidatus Bathyarchaeota archaeon]|nr:hypothetical protein [Candidatus Termiticorpusculum sp.]
MSLTDKKPNNNVKKKTRRRTIRSPKNVILEVLTPSNKLTWAELLKLTELGQGTLSDHLNQLINNKEVETQIDSNRPPKTLYALADPLVEKNEKQTEDPKKYSTTSFAIYAGHLISKIEDREIARKMFYEYLEHMMTEFASTIFAAFWYNGVNWSIVNRIKNGEKLSNMSNEISQMWKECSKKIDANSKIEALFWAAIKNSDIALDDETEIPVLIELMANKDDEQTHSATTNMKLMTELFNAQKDM